jgi:Ca2+-binding EF-hand superfamily protein
MVKRELLKREDFIKSKAFNEIAKGMECINLQTLVEFLEKCLFCPKREELEAILRRVDHEGKQKINYDEFCEVTSVNGENMNGE